MNCETSLHVISAVRSSTSKVICMFGSLNNFDQRHVKNQDRRRKECQKTRH